MLLYNLIPKADCLLKTVLLIKFKSKVIHVVVNLQVS